jgi:hypothetical protein
LIQNKYFIKFHPACQRTLSNPLQDLRKWK